MHLLEVAFQVEGKESTEKLEMPRRNQKQNLHICTPLSASWLLNQYKNSHKKDWTEVWSHKTVNFKLPVSLYWTSVKHQGWPRNRLVSRLESTQLSGRSIKIGLINERQDQKIIGCSTTSFFFFYFEVDGEGKEKEMELLSLSRWLLKDCLDCFT